ncbi:phosphoenolpyruvate synthase [Altererythrobacter confluentis]|uniref:Phosphoenolpyruvate synthase n=1 Tax=Allopontixanthobacter confluentis TaxID=1849021 RepID=A0A6L7GC78_9SPHN|nr:phosphoenolpyruvate synthase [Allopontixanthobacter confluentis]MXP13220.1 phosphoenolpyruvate synthase [Allopontixanthobacter confluentis]
MTPRLIVDLSQVTRADIALVGGKNASLGELIGSLAPLGVGVPPGFATTADAFRAFLAHNRLTEGIAGQLARQREGEIALADAGAAVRSAIAAGSWPAALEMAIRQAYRALCTTAQTADLAVAVRSSATAEDLPEASFAGQQETFLNISGEDALLAACQRCYASLYTDRAIAYRAAHGFAENAVALSIDVQQMVRADLAGAGVMFSIDTESGFPHVVLIEGAWGLGENVVQGAVEPDAWQVFKPLLGQPMLHQRAISPIILKRRGTKAAKMVYSHSDGATTANVPTSEQEQARFVLGDSDILQLARWAVLIEDHYGCPMDMEWAKDGPDGRLFIVQARPETVQSQQGRGTLRTYAVEQAGMPLVTGLAIGNGAVSGPVCRISHAADIGDFVDGSVLVTSTTDPDWGPIMQRAAAIVTDHGGRTSHAAIVSREFGLPAIVGAGNATEILQPGEMVTVSCASGDLGTVYKGAATITARTINLASLPETATKVMLNLADPAAAAKWWQLPADGVGLTRMEFVIANAICVHPMALVHFDTLEDGPEKARIAQLTQGFADKGEYFIEHLSRNLARIAAVFYPATVMVRMSDFKTNEYAGLLGGSQFEPVEENPMLGFRGASRYYSSQYRAGFALECRAIRRLREDLGFTNVAVMIPFCRTVTEADKVLAVMAQEGLRRGEAGLETYVMCEIPANVVLAGEFARRFDGFSIGSNDLTQLTLGIDRDSELLADQFDERDAAVEWMIRHVIKEAHQHGCKVGLCGQAPSDHPEFAAFLVECGIDSISVTPDSFVAVKRHVAEAEAAAHPGRQGRAQSR